MRAANYSHDLTGTLIEPFIDNPDLGDSLLFLQGMEGLIAKLEIPHVEELSGVIVNKADVTISLANLDNASMV